MTKRLLLFIIILSCSFMIFMAQGQEEEQSAPAPPPARMIPAITAEDSYPNACVDCHINYVEMNLDTRFSTLLKNWSEKVEPKILAQAQASAPEGMTLKGKHPKATSSLKNIPAGCLKCHGSESKSAPPLSKMLHIMHYAGGEQNPYLTFFQGECTHCHKPDLSTGQWIIPSGPER